MSAWRGSWSTYAATSGFRVRPSRALRLGGAAVAGLVLLAFVQAPLATVAGIAAAAPACLLRGRVAALPRRLRPRRLQLDPESGTVTLATAHRGARTWRLRSWLRHPWLIILYLERGAGRHGCVLLPADALARAGHRRLHYLLGVSSVGAGSSARSG